MKIIVFLLLAAFGLGCSNENKDDIPPFELTIARSFHRLLKYSVSNHGSGYSAELIIFSGVRGSNWDTVRPWEDTANTMSRSLDSVEVRTLATIVSDLDLDVLSKKEDWGNVVYMDGAEWELIIKTKDSNITLSRWSPTYDTDKRNLEEFRKLGEFLWRLFDIGEPDHDFY